VLLEHTDTNESYEEEASAVFIFAGTIPQASFLSAGGEGAAGGEAGITGALNPKRDGEGYIITDQNMAASVEGLFAAGDIRATPFRQVVVAAGEGAVAAHCAAAYIEGL
jgi:thioredoxin reductase (NADPH)